jgi:tetratricopeptide (TPR) repeat protein
VVAGTAGAGKTSLVLHWAHQIKDRFPDGQLYVNLRGYDPGAPVTAREALHRFLPALGVPAREVPDDVDAAAALHRSLLADRRMLILLDNAATVGQVRPLLPGGGNSLVVVTSRSRLSGLAVRDGARRLTLGTLPEAEAIALLRAVTSGYRPDDDPAKLAELARLCARLPLALRIAAERAASHPHMRLDDLIADLRDESALWDALSTGDHEEDDAVRTVFAWSYRALSQPAARLFRLLGLHPGPEFGLEAAAALAQLTINRARQLLDDLVGAHLVEQIAPDRYQFHDLLRAYAVDQAQLEEPAEEREAALRRVLDWYLRAADAAQGWIKPTELRVPLGEPEPKAPPTPVFADYNAAVDWSEREHINLLPMVRATVSAGFDQLTWQLTEALWHSLAPTSSVADWLELGRIGLAAAERSDDPAAQVRLLTSLGMACRAVNRLDESLRCHQQALEVCRASGDRLGAADSLNLIGLVHLNRRELTLAARHFEQAMVVFRDEGSAYLAATTLSNLATTHFNAGRLAEADATVEEALAAHRALGNERGVGNILRLRAELRCEQGQIEEALRSAQEALDIALGLRGHRLEGYWLLTLANAQRSATHFAEALTSYQRSATLHRRLADRSREALAWRGVGETYLRLDRAEEAVAFHRQAVAVHEELADAWNQALELECLGTALSVDDPAAARPHWAHALRLLEPYGDPRAARTRDRIERRAAGGGAQ